jgi:hypothetical protein
VERIGDDVRLVLRRFGSTGEMDELVRAWPAAVGDSIAQNAWPARLARDGTLHVATTSSAWAFELTQLEPSVRGHLREALGKSAPKRLRFSPGRVPERGPEPSAASPKPPLEPDAEEVEAAARIAAKISDDELRELVARAAAASLASARSGRPLW